MCGTFGCIQMWLTCYPLNQSSKLTNSNVGLLRLLPNVVLQLENSSEHIDAAGLLFQKMSVAVLRGWLCKVGLSPGRGGTVASRSKEARAPVTGGIGWDDQVPGRQNRERGEGNKMEGPAGDCLSEPDFAGSSSPSKLSIQLATRETCTGCRLSKVRKRR